MLVITFVLVPGITGRGLFMTRFQPRKGLFNPADTDPKRPCGYFDGTEIQPPSLLKFGSAPLNVFQKVFQTIWNKKQIFFWYKMTQKT